MRAGKLSLGFLVVSALLGAAGCVDNGASVFIQQVPVPDPEDECITTADPSALMDNAGSLDTFYSYTFNVNLLIGNQLIQRGDEDTLRLESARVQFFEVEAEVFDFDGNLLSSFIVPTSGFVDAGSGDTPGYGLVGATLIDPCAAGQVIERSPQGEQVVSRIIARGETLGGDEVETRPWDYPIFVGYGNLACLVGPDDEPAPFCSPGQNRRIDCRWEVATLPEPTGAACL